MPEPGLETCLGRGGIWEGRELDLCEVIDSDCRISDSDGFSEKNLANDDLFDLILLCGSVRLPLRRMLPSFACGVLLSLFVTAMGGSCPGRLPDLFSL